MHRREFLKNSVVVGAGIAAAPGLARTALAADGPLVAMVKGGSIADMVTKAVDAVGGMSHFVDKGQTVVVKPNIGWDRTPELAANTHPEVVKAVVQLCLAAGAAKVKIFDRTCNDPRRCYVSSGIAAMLEEVDDDRVEVTQIDERRFRRTPLEGALLLKNWPYYEEVLEADRFINLPIAKHHSAAGLTIGLKNVMGVIGSNRATLHRNLPESLVDMNRVIRSHLTVVDATRILVANGPQGGRIEDVRKLDTVIASADVVAADAVAASLFNKGMDDLSYLRLAHEHGLGVGDLNRIRLQKIEG